jgi:hypothetical protein
MSRISFNITKTSPRYGVFETDEEVEMYKDYFVRMYTKDDLKLSLLQLVKRENLRGVKIHYTQAQRILKEKGIRKRKHRRYREKTKQSVKVYLEDDLFSTLEKYDIPVSFIMGKLVRCFLGLDSPDVLFVYLDDKRPVMFMYKQPASGDKNLSVNIIAPIDISQTEESLIRAVGEMAVTEPSPIEFIKQYFKRIDRPCFGGTTKVLTNPKTQFKK